MKSGDRRLKTHEMEYSQRDHAWIATFGQKKNGKSYVVVVMVEHGGGGGSTVAGPVAVLEGLSVSFYDQDPNFPAASAEAAVEDAAAPVATRSGESNQMDKRLFSHINWGLLACMCILFLAGVGNLYSAKPAARAWKTAWPFRILPAAACLGRPLRLSA